MFSAPVLGQVLVNGISLGAIYILIALGFTLLFGIMRVVNFAHGAMAMLGGYALLYAYEVYHLPFWLAIVVAPAGIAIVSLVLERFVFRHFYNRMFQSMIGLLGLETVLVFSAVLIWDAHERSIKPAFDGIIDLGNLILSVDRLAVAGIAATALILFYAFMRYTRMGLALRAVSQDGEIASVQGINATYVYIVAFLIATFLAALAGGLYSQIYALSPFIGERILMVAFVVVILGGMGSIPGAALGGMLLGLAESFISTFYGASISAFVSFGVVLLLLIVRPWGLMGQRE
jgi:branched-chain amino acid transport system permease protein